MVISVSYKKCDPGKMHSWIQIIPWFDIPSLCFFRPFNFFSIILVIVEKKHFQHQILIHPYLYDNHENVFCERFVYTVKRKKNYLMLSNSGFPS